MIRCMYILVYKVKHAYIRSVSYEFFYVLYFNVSYYILNSIAYFTETLKLFAVFMLLLLFFLALHYYYGGEFKLEKLSLLKRFLYFDELREFF